MTLTDIVKELNLKVAYGKEHLNREVSGGYCSDLLSDVMGGSEENQVWITIQVHRNTIAVAALKELAAIILVNGLEPNPDTIAAAQNEEFPILVSQEKAFDVAGKIYKLLN